MRAYPEDDYRFGEKGLKPYKLANEKVGKILDGEEVDGLSAEIVEVVKHVAALAQHAVSGDFSVDVMEDLTLDPKLISTLGRWNLDRNTANIAMVYFVEKLIRLRRGPEDWKNRKFDLKRQIEQLNGLNFGQSYPKEEAVNELIEWVDRQELELEGDFDWDGEEESEQRRLLLMTARRLIMELILEERVSFESLGRTNRGRSRTFNVLSNVFGIRTWTRADFEDICDVNSFQDIKWKRGGEITIPEEVSLSSNVKAAARRVVLNI